MMYVAPITVVLTAHRNIGEIVFTFAFLSTMSFDGGGRFFGVFCRGVGLVVHTLSISCRRTPQSMK